MQYRWLECADTPVHPSYPRAVQIIILTGQRVEEIARLHVDRWDAKERIIDWSKTKNLQPHAVPVPSLAAELIEAIKPNEYGWFFPSAKDPSIPVSHATLYSFVWRQRDRGVIPVCDQPQSAADVQDAGRKRRCLERDPRPASEPRAAGCEFQELRSLELHAREARLHDTVG